MFGNAASVLVGDFLYSRAFQMMVSVNRMRVLEVLADATNVIAEGEVLQLMNMHDPDLAVEDYLRSSATRPPSCSRPAPAWAPCWRAPTPTLEESLRRLRPLAGHRLPARRRPARLRRQQRRTGQERRRRPARRQADAAAADCDGARHAERARADPPRHRAWRGAAACRRSSTIVRRTGALDATRAAAQREADQAAADLRALPASAAREALLELCVSVGRTARSAGLTRQGHAAWSAGLIGV